MSLVSYFYQILLLNKNFSWFYLAEEHFFKKNQENNITGKSVKVAGEKLGELNDIFTVLDTFTNCKVYLPSIPTGLKFPNSQSFVCK